ncbi:MAG: hypothetical protein KA419_00815 [Acidobacteria bacterium]|nr:hypothetical protein [Acidobacteriota bacterium]
MNLILVAWNLVFLFWAALEAWRFDRLQYRRLGRRMFSFAPEKFALPDGERSALRRFKLALVIALLGTVVEVAVFTLAEMR